MSDVNEDLKILLNVIDKICEQPEKYAWFKKELQKRFGSTSNDATETPAVYINQQEDRIKNIESYLALDRELDDRQSLIDYSFINDLNVREQLTQDNREMRRYRLGLRGHKIDFEEFCRYAILQIEMLFNYFYFTICSGNLNSIIARIKNYGGKVDDNINSLPAISLKSKMFAFCKECDLDRIKRVIGYIIDVRNKVSHRSPSIDKDYKQLYAELKELGLFYVNSSNINWNTKMSKKTMDKANQFQFLDWLHKEPCDSVVEVITIVASTIKSKLIIP